MNADAPLRVADVRIMRIRGRMDGKECISGDCGRMNEPRSVHEPKDEGHGRADPQQGYPDDEDDEVEAVIGLGQDPACVKDELDCVLGCEKSAPLLRDPLTREIDWFRPYDICMQVGSVWGTSDDFRAGASMR